LLHCNISQIYSLAARLQALFAALQHFSGDVLETGTERRALRFGWGKTQRMVAASTGADFTFSCP